MKQNITRLVVNFFVTVFIIVVIFTVLLLLLYYFTPNNYILELYEKSKHNLIKEYIVSIKPNSSIVVPIDDSNNYIMRFLNLKKKSEEPIKLEEPNKLENKLKSMNENEINFLLCIKNKI